MVVFDFGDVLVSFFCILLLQKFNLKNTNLNSFVLNLDSSVLKHLFIVIQNFQNKTQNIVIYLKLMFS